MLSVPALLLLLLLALLLSSLPALLLLSLPSLLLLSLLALILLLSPYLPCSCIPCLHFALLLGYLMLQHNNFKKEQFCISLLYNCHMLSFDFATKSIIL
jgi:hypothetical protein